MISVIVPIYKTEKFLEKCVNSILQQTYKDLEVILVDDGSPDGCGEICDAYAQKDSRVRVIHKENGGRSSARNAGIECAQGEYLAFVDSDDWIDPEMYETLLRLAKETDADIAECSYRFYRPWKTENKVLDGENTGKISVYSNVEALEKLYFGPQLFSEIAIMVWNKLYKASIFENIRFIEGYNFEDVEITPRVLYKAKKIAKIDRSFCNYNIHLNTYSTSGMKISVNKVWDGIYMRQKVMEFFSQNYVEKISPFTAFLYYNALRNGYYECRCRKREPEFHDLQRMLEDFIIQHRADMMVNSFLANSWKNKLFLKSPTTYTILLKAHRKFKEMKYRLRVLLTGKN